MSTLETPFGPIKFITPANWPSDRIALLTEAQLQECRREAERVVLGEEQPLSEHARKAKQADTPHWITPTP